MTDSYTEKADRIVEKAGEEIKKIIIERAKEANPFTMIIFLHGQEDYGYAYFYRTQSEKRGLEIDVFNGKHLVLLPDGLYWFFTGKLEGSNYYDGFAWLSRSSFSNIEYLTHYNQVLKKIEERSKELKELKTLYR